jgi:hypothetical protein
MLLKFINSNRLSLIVVITLLPVLYWIPSWVSASTLQMMQDPGVPLGKLIVLFNSNFRLLASVIALLLLLGNSYLLIQMNTNFIFIPVRTQLPALFYLLLCTGITQLHELTPALVSSTFLIWMFYRLFSAYKTDGVSVHFLDCGLLISVASIVYFPSVIFFFFLLAAISLLRPFIWREWVFALIGLLIPYLFLFSGYYLGDISVPDLISQISESFTNLNITYKLSQMVNWAVVLLFIISGSYFIATYFDSMKIHARKFFLVFWVFFLFGLLVFLVRMNSGIGMVYFVSIPLAYLFSFYFIKCKANWINELVFALLLALWIWQRV